MPWTLVTTQEHTLSFKFSDKKKSSDVTSGDVTIIRSNFLLYKVHPIRECFGTEFCICQQIFKQELSKQLNLLCNYSHNYTNQTSNMCLISFSEQVLINHKEYFNREMYKRIIPIFQWSWKVYFEENSASYGKTRKRCVVRQD